jgi:hypothetical protein
MIFLGDEPKYLRMAYSLASDGDLDLTDDFVGDDVEVYGLLQKARASGKRAIGDYSIVGRGGGIYHFHMPGISALILPSFLLDLKVFPRSIPNLQPLMFLPAKMVFTRAWLMILALGFFLLVARFYDRVFRSSLILAALLLGLLFLTKVPEFMLQVYPETAAGACLFLGLNALFFPFSRPWPNRLALIAGIGFLPWLHQRFIPLALSLYVLYLFQALGSKRQGKEFLGVSLGLAGIGLGYAYFFYSITGSPMPWSLYSLWGTSYTRPAIFPSGFFGYLFDTSSGLLAQFPVFLFALTGIYWAAKLDRRQTGRLMVVVLPYFCLISITPWHGISWETMRMSLILFPLFLVFVGYTIRALTNHTSWPHLVFYSAGLAFLLWNKTRLFWEISLGNVLVLPHQVGYIIQCAVVLVLFCLALWGLDRWTEKRLGPLPLPRIRRFLQERRLRFKRGKFRPAMGKALVGLGLAFPILYSLIFINNWGDKTLAPSYFSAVAKVRRWPEVHLHRLDRPSIGYKKSDEEFVDLFSWEVPFQLSPGEQRQSVRFGPRILFAKCPAGCYRVDLEFYDPPEALTNLSLDFRHETRQIEVNPRPGTTTVSATYLVFEDMFISPEFVLRYATPLSRAVKGKMLFSPVPCVIFGKKLILQPGDDLSREALRTHGSRTYLTLTAYARKVHSTYVFRLSPLEGASDGVVAVDFRTGSQQRLSFPLDVPGSPWPENGVAAFSASDGSGRSLKARRDWLPFLKAGNVYTIVFSGR